jgi:hypothetical protein
MMKRLGNSAFSSFGRAGRPPRGACLDENVIVAFLQGKRSRARALEEHIDFCASCRRLVSELARILDAALRTHLPPDRPPSF